MASDKIRAQIKRELTDGPVAKAAADYRFRSAFLVRLERIARALETIATAKSSEKGNRR